MEISNQAASTGAYASPRTPVYTPEVATRIAKGLELAAVVSDTSGKFSRDEQITAWDALFGKVVTGTMAGWSDEDRKTVEHAIGNSAIAKRMNEIHQENYRMHTSAIESSTNVSRAHLQHFDALSETDKKIFWLGRNPIEMDGTRNYKNINEWRTDTLASAELVDYLKKAEAPGFIEAEAEGDKYTQIQSFLVRMDNEHKVGWGSALLKLLQAPMDRVDLSDKAKTAVGSTRVAEEPVTQQTQGVFLDTSV